MRLEGSLDAFSLPDIFQLLSFTKKSGALHLRRADLHGVVFFTVGGVTGAVSDDSRQALGRRLVGAGRVEDSALSAAVSRAGGNSGVGLVRALSEAGAVDGNVLREVLAEHIVDAVFDLLRWPDGDFAFSVDERNPDDIELALPVDELVAEARRRIDYWAQISQVVPSRDTVLSLSTEPTHDPVVSRDEWAMLGLVDGRRTVEELVSVTGRGEYALVASLAALVERGLLIVAASPDADPVYRLTRRLALLAPLETAPTAVVVPPARAERPPLGETRVEEVTIEGPQQTATAAAADSRSFVPQAAAPAQRGAESVTSLPPEDRNVTPARQETVVPRRRPDFPDTAIPAQGSSSSAGASMGSAATAAATAPAISIERDPSVNKSLLLRLIAGVRGL